MGMTMTQKILARHAGRDAVAAGQTHRGPRRPRPGQRHHRAHGHPRDSRRSAPGDVFDTKKIVLVPDHFTPNKDIKAAEQCREMRQFAGEQGIVNYFEVGTMGIEHALLPEKGLVVAGRRRHRRRLPHLHLRRPGRLRHGRRLHGHGRRHGHRARAGSGCPRPSSSSSRAGRPSGSAARTSSCTSSASIGVDGALYQSMEFSGMGLRHSDAWTRG